jgi:hypothetical protein
MAQVTLSEGDYSRGPRSSSRPCKDSFLWLLEEEEERVWKQENDQIHLL